MKQHSRYRVARGFLIFWCLFIGMGAVAGATGMLVAPDGSALGMAAMLPYFQVLPFADVLFRDFVFSGIALLCVNGLTNLIAAALIFANRKSGIVCGGIFGVTLMAWICIQFVIFPLNFMSTIYFVFGFAQAATGYAATIFYRQERFTVDADAYKNVGTNPASLVVYFSRMGYTKKLAYEAAEQSGACIYEIKSTEPTAGTGGFWWCGWYGLRGESMPIEEISIDLTQYDNVTICAPVWVSRLASPVRTFCQKAAGQIKSVDYILLHHMYAPFERVADSADSLLGLKRTELTSVRCHAGKYKTVLKK